MPYNRNSIRLTSTAADGTQGDGASDSSSLSADGGRVAFVSFASNLVADDTNGQRDIFVKDPASGAIVLASTAADGTQADFSCQQPSLSADGGEVAFVSFASNLVADDTNDQGDIFVKDPASGAIIRASTAADGGEADRSSFEPSLSADGGRVAFSSGATNLVADDTNERGDIFVKDPASGAIVRASTAANGGEANNFSAEPSLSADGGEVAFTSLASNLVAGDTNGGEDIFVKDPASGAIVRASVGADGTQGNSASFEPSLSADGGRVAFSSFASNLVADDTNGEIDIFVKDLASGEVIRASTAADGTEANGSSETARLTADGTRVVFESSATNLVPGDTNGDDDVFIKDLATGAITRIVAADGGQTNGFSANPSLSADGRALAFESFASNLVSNDTNDTTDIFTVRLAPTAGDDVLLPLAVQEPVQGRQGKDQLIGTEARDELLGGQGADLLQGLGADDAMRVGPDGTFGRSATASNDAMLSSSGVPDRVAIGGLAESHDVFQGGAGSDLIGGRQPAADVVLLEDTSNPVFAGQSAARRVDGIERIDLKGGNDVLDLTASSGEGYTTGVRVVGGFGNDTLWTGAGADTLQGNQNDDYLVGAAGDDILTGGGNRDLFGISEGFGADTVTDYADGLDRIRVTGFGSDLDSFAELEPSIAQDGADTLITFTDDTTVTLRLLNEDRANLGASDFVFVA